MNKDELKEVIVEFRDKGMSYQEIADKLYSEYGIIRSRQAVYGMYQREKDREVSKKACKVATCIDDVVNLYSLGYSVRFIMNYCREKNKIVTRELVNSILEENNLYLKDIIKGNIESVMGMVMTGMNYNEISLRFVYDKCIIKRQLLYKIVEDAIKELQLIDEGDYDDYEKRYGSKAKREYEMTVREQR